MNWQDYFVNMLDAVSLKSKDKTKCSAIIVGPDHEIRSTGYNGMPRGMNDYDKNKWQKPEKYFWVEHAERNAIYNAARVGTGINNCVIYVSHFPCVDCARAIINSGIKRVVVSDKNLEAFNHESSIYYEHKQKTIEMFRQCKVSLLIHGEEEDTGDFDEVVTDPILLKEMIKEDLDNLWGV